MFFSFWSKYCQGFTELKNNNNTIKNQDKDLFTNLKLLCFVEREKVKNFYEEILYKFRTKFPKFLNILKNIILKKKLFNKLCWNYN